MQVSKKEYYEKLEEYCTKYNLKQEIKNQNHNFIYYTTDGEQSYAPIGEINLLEVPSYNNKLAYEYQYFLLPAINKKPKKVKI